MRILITGSRDWPDDGSVETEIAQAISVGFTKANTDMSHVVIVHGDCPSGADRLARDYARRLKLLGRPVDEEAYPADWNLGKGAGFTRNQVMVDLGADVCIAFYGPCRKHPGENHPSHGTTHCAERAYAAGIDVIPVTKAY